MLENYKLTTMKELSIEEKAKAYDKAIEKFDVILNLNTVKESGTIFADDVRKIFPELKESEDEKIRKALIKYYSFDKDGGSHALDNITPKQIVTWLEKQGEQKPDSGGFWEGYNTAKEKFKQEPADKVEPIEWSGKINSRNAKGVLKEMLDKKLKSEVEPKFKVGDFIVNDYCMGKVIELTNDAYLLDTGQGIPFSCEHNAHLWTIKDAKDGDVLFHSDSASNGIFIFKELLKYEFNEKVICYCDYDSEDHFCLGEHHTCCWANDKILHPATKEQRDLLFQKMKEAGYEWDAEKKELKKVEQKKDEYNKLTDFETSLKHIMEEAIECGDTHNLKADADMLLRLVQKPAWSEKDEVKDNWEYIQDFIKKLGHFPKDSDELDVLINYVLSKKQKFAWNKEDEKIINDLLWIIEAYRKNGFNETHKYIADKSENWLKSLKPQNKWKPSDEQMLAINTAINVLGKGTLNGKQLIELQEELQKLREE